MALLTEEEGHQAMDLIDDLAKLFGDVEDMEEMDAADFKDNASKIWSLRQRARKLVKGK